MEYYRYKVKLDVMGLQLGKIATVMQVPFLVLSHLEIDPYDGSVSVLSARFLGGSAPCLQKVTLVGEPYPSLLTLFLPVSDLVTVELQRISLTGYISPEETVVGLAALLRLQTFLLGFKLATSCPD